jgi:hypothetical protein
MTLLTNNSHGAIIRNGSHAPLRYHLPRSVWILLALLSALAAGLALYNALEPAGRQIKGELEAAASILQAAPPAPNEQMVERLHNAFSHREVSIDTALWPIASVTLYRLDAETCREAVEEARRIDGLVAIALERYRSPDDCQSTNDMTWRLMP